MISASFAGGSSAGESNTHQRDREFPPRLVRRHRAPGHRRKKGCGPDLQPARLDRPSDFSRGGPSRPPSRAQMAFQPRPLPATSATGPAEGFPGFHPVFWESFRALKQPSLRIGTRNGGRLQSIPAAWMRGPFLLVSAKDRRRICNFSSPSSSERQTRREEQDVKMWRRIGFSLLAVILLAGCSTERTSPQPENRTVQRSLLEPLDVKQEAIDPQAPSASSSTEQALKKAGQPHAPADEKVPPEQKVIYRADVDMRVSRYEQAREQMEKEARKLGGYIINETESRDGKTLRGTIVFRIPQQRFQDFLSALEKQSVEITSKQIQGTDVTEEYVDLKSRLRAKQAVEKRLMELMKQAKKPEDLLNITNHLSQVQEEIERIKGRMRYLDDRIDYATVTVNLEQPIVLENPSAGLWQQILQAFVDSTAGLLNTFRKALILLAAVLPPLLILAAIGIPLWRRYRRRRASAAPPPDEK